MTAGFGSVGTTGEATAAVAMVVGEDRVEVTLAAVAMLAMLGELLVAWAALAVC